MSSCALDGSNAAMLTNSTWSAPDGQLMRDPARVIADLDRSAAVLGFGIDHTTVDTRCLRHHVGSSEARAAPGRGNSPTASGFRLFPRVLRSISMSARARFRSVTSGTLQSM